MDILSNFYCDDEIMTLLEISIDFFSNLFNYSFRHMARENPSKDF